MKRVLLAISAVVLASSAFAADEKLTPPKLFTDKNCLTCHAVDKKLVGPAYKDIATKYKGNKDAPAALATKVIKGSAGAWGPVPMPANAQVNEAEAKQLVTWILNVK